ncbi:hypothetical protein [Dyella sp. OK004]|uniref:hypothetical protein n=1 Tax=Dyella sp. OK004 TaxID=1855292 RepID=UPI0021010228|nr:hypothetical protein [Dyella sp. OK004]
MFALVSAAAMADGRPTVASYFASTAGSPVAAYIVAANSGRAVYVDGFGHGVDAGVLDGMSGGADVSERMTLNGTVSNNDADHVVTGFNSISAGSFAGASGVPMVIQNTGNNVLIQNATIINVQFKP